MLQIAAIFTVTVTTWKAIELEYGLSCSNAHFYNWQNNYLIKMFATLCIVHFSHRKEESKVLV